MEININNAFCEAFKFCLRPCCPLYVAVSDSIQQTMYKVVCRLLQAPLSATFAAFFFLIPLTMMLTFSFLTYIGIIYVIFSIIMIEAYSVDDTKLRTIYYLITISMVHHRQTTRRIFMKFNVVLGYCPRQHKGYVLHRKGFSFSLENKTNLGCNYNTTQLGILVFL